MRGVDGGNEMGVLFGDGTDALINILSGFSLYIGDVDGLWPDVSYHKRS